MHHPDHADWARRFEDASQADQHRKFIEHALPLGMLIHTFWPGANDFLLHVSQRAVLNVSAILNTIVRVTRNQLHEPEFVVPEDYLTP